MKSGWERIYRSHEKKIDAFASIALGLVAWEALDRSISNPLILVGPARIWSAMIDLAFRGELWRHVQVTFTEFLLGFLLGVGIGIAAGVLMALSRAAREILNPWVTMTYNAPIILLAPVFITALGVGMASKVAIVFIGAVYPVLFNTYAAITTVDARLVEAVRAFGGTRWQIFFKVSVPSALPLVMTGLRLSVGRAIIGAIVSEFFGSKAGIGHLITAASEAFRTAEAFVGVVLLALAGCTIFESLKALERRVAPWYRFKV